MATPKSTQLYGKLSADAQLKFGEVVIEKLRTLIGGYGELSVLSEYIAVMLQSSRPPEQIQSELDAFLQEESRPFTNWLCEQLATFAGEAGSAQTEAKGEALLLRAVRDARQGTGGDVIPVKRRGRREEAQPDGRREERQHREKRRHGGAVAVAAPIVQERPVARHREEERSRSRPRRRHGGQGRDASPRVEANGNSAGSREAVDRKAMLTPNVKFLRDAYHQKDMAHEEAAATPPPQPDTRWHFRADPGPPQGGYASQPVAAFTPAAAHGYPVPGPPPPHHQVIHHYGAPPGALGPAHGPPAAEPMQSAPVSSSRPRYFPPKKWRVARPNTMVRATEHLESEEVQLLQEGEIIEQVAPAFKLKTGIVRIQIRHPSSPQFPNPIGWVTQDATAAGGPKFLEPGPEPMAKGGGGGGKGWKGGPMEEGGKGWGAPEDFGKGKGKGKNWKGGPPGSFDKGFEKGGKPAMAPPEPFAGAAAGPRGPYGTFQNLIWKPGGGGGEAVVISA